MVKFTSKVPKTLFRSKLPPKPRTSYLKPQYLFTDLTNNLDTNTYLLKRQNLLNNYIFKNTYTKNPVKYFFNTTLTSRLEKLHLISKIYTVPKLPGFSKKLAISSLTTTFNLWSFPQPITKRVTKTSFHLLRKLFKKKQVSKKKWRYVNRFKGVNERLQRLLKFKKHFFNRRKYRRIWAFKKQRFFFYNKPRKRFSKGKGKKKYEFNSKMIYYLNYISNRSKILKPYTRSVIQKLRLPKKAKPILFKKRKFNKKFVKKKTTWKVRFRAWQFTAFFNANRRVSIHKIGLRLFSLLKPKTERFLLTNFNKSNTKLNLKKFHSKYSYYDNEKRCTDLYFSHFVRFKQSQNREEFSISPYIKFLNPLFRTKLSSTDNIITTPSLINTNILNSFILSYFFKTFNLNPVNPLTQVFSRNKIINQLFAKSFVRNKLKLSHKNNIPIINSLNHPLPMKKYYLIKPSFSRNIYKTKIKKWSVTKLSLELNNFVFFSQSNEFKFDYKKIHLNFSSFKFKNLKMFALGCRKHTANDPFSSTYNLVSDLGFMPALPLIYYEDAPGFLLNYDTETLYKAMPCTHKKVDTVNTTNFLVSFPKTYKLYNFHLYKGNSYFELNNVLNPSLGHSVINQKTISKNNLNYSSSLSVINYGTFASTKYVQPVDDHNNFPFRKYLNPKPRPNRIKKIRQSITKPSKPKRLFYKIRRVTKWTKSKFIQFLKKYNICENTSLLNNPLILNKKSLFQGRVSIKNFSKAHLTRFNKFSKSNFRYFCKSVTLAQARFGQTFDYPHKSSLLTLTDNFLQVKSKNKYKTFFDILFENFSNINKFIYSKDIIIRLLTNRFFFKNFIYKFNSFTSTKSMIISVINALARNSRNYFFNDRIIKYRKSNLIPLTCFNFEIQRFVVQHVRGGLWLMVSTQVITTLLIRFVENVSGRKALLRFAPNAFKFLDIKDHARAIAWEPRIKSWQLMLGPKFFAAETLKLIGVMLRSRDPYFFTRWVVLVSSRLDFFNHRRFFRLIRLLLKWYYSLFFDEFGLTGIKLKFKGKISVAGNSRKRSQFARAGITSNSKVSNRVTSDINYIYTFTGAVAFQIWLYF